MFLIGFIIGYFLFFLAIPRLVNRLFLSSHVIKPQRPMEKPIHSIKNKIVISFAYIIPLAVIALIFSTIVGAQITRNLTEQGHGQFVFFSLTFPLFGFLLGYLYFKKSVKQ